jgi:hypothetical protein
MATQFIDDDFVLVREAPNSEARRVITLAFGDAVEVIGTQGGWTEIRVLNYFDRPFPGFVKGTPPVRNKGVLRLSMVDVQQGDGLVLETPDGKIVLIDGGDNKLFARHVAARFLHRQSTAEQPLEVEAIIVTHGDADHFDGLNDIFRSESLPSDGDMARKRLFIYPKRIYHNGLVKRPTENASGQRIPERDLFGRSIVENGKRFAIDLDDDLRQTPESALNEPFKRWVKSIRHWATRGPIEMRRIEFGMDESALFDFLHDDGIRIELQGPFATTATDPDTGEQTPALAFFHKPKRTAELHLEQGGQGEGEISASHTINGHSIAFRLTYGNVRFSLTGDLNQEAMANMLANIPAAQLEAEIVKAPHHGSHDFDFRTLRAMRPVVAMVSSGDESAAKEYIHPRATLMAALGKSMSGDIGIIFLTELAAFFSVKNDCHTRADLATFFAKHKERTFTGEELRQFFTGQPRREEDPPGLFFGFERTNFGIVHIRTDGERVLAFTHSGKQGLNEAYRFHVKIEDGARFIQFSPAVSTR